MSQREHILLTGATGQIGRYLLRDLLEQGRPVAVLVRSSQGMSAKQRVRQLLTECEQMSGRVLPMPVCLQGDTTQPGFGLSERDRHWVQDHCATLLHNAANVEFQSSAGETWQNNVQSAQRTLEVCRENKLEHLVFVSTAYVAGRRTDLVFEDQLDCGQSFRNEYEHSKFEAERTIRAASDIDCVTVLRPAIVVGDHHTGYTHSYHSFYQFALFTWMFANSAEKDAHGRWKHNVRLTLTGDELRNLVCLDWVSSAMTAIVADPNCWGKTFHLTPKRPTRVHEVEAALQRYFHYDGVKYVGPAGLDLSSGSSEEKRFYEYLSGYSEYWENDPCFDRSNTDAATAHIPEPPVDIECMQRLIDFAVRTRFGRQAKGARARHVQRDDTPSIALR
jgi:nucleoside-diphosphate-sugar epimerase